VTPARAREWVAAGINRVSLGAQSFDPGVLAWMHRTHTAEQVVVAAAALRDAGIADLSIDLIFGLPASLGRDWAADLEQAFALDPQHLSLYGLAVEDHTPLARWVIRGKVQPVDDERYAGEFLEADRALRERGFEHYEVSNAARPGFRARHNSAYWRRAPFIGLGPSAHSGFGAERSWNVREWAAYERAMRQGVSPIADHEALHPDAVHLEELYLGLRTIDGVEVTRISPPELERWTASGWARLQAGHVVLTAEGWLRLDALVAAASPGPPSTPAVP
jgi:oxygen-independent coproporphyrinogen-3 oxidase